MSTTVNADTDNTELLNDPQSFVNAAMAIWRVFVSKALLRAEIDGPKKVTRTSDRSVYREFDPAEVRNLTEVKGPLFEKLIARLKAGSPAFVSTEENKQSRFHVFALSPLEFVRRSTGNSLRFSDLQYYVRRNIRSYYNLPFSPEVTKRFTLLARILNNHFSTEIIWGRDKKPDESSAIWRYKRELLPCLEAGLKDISTLEGRKSTIDCFIESCLLVGYLQFMDKFGYVRFRCNEIETEFLISHLFGLPTDITGFDTLFGGGGMILPEYPNHSRLPARVTLIKGTFGTGKTLLSLQLATEVARKGGIAWVIPFEQSTDEYLYILESMGLARDCRVKVATTPPGAVVAARKAHSLGTGLLVILKSPRDSFEEFFSALVDKEPYLEKFPVKLLVADPLNSLVHPHGKSPDLIRKQIVDSLARIKKLGTNVLLVVEEGANPSDRQLSEAFIADTVIRLSVQERHQYMQRIIEITKSRLQREQRGEHPFSIRPGCGVCIFPSTAAVNARIQPRRIAESAEEISFGITGVDNILGKDALYSGDVVVLQGPAGANKTILGLAFLLGAGGRRSDTLSHTDAPVDWRKQCSLMVAARDTTASIRHTLRQPLLAPYRNRSVIAPKDIRIYSLRPGFVSPGYIFQLLEDAFRQARADGMIVRRIMVDNIAHLEMSCPFIAEDETFGDTLLRFLRRQQVTTLLICGDANVQGKTSLQKTVVDSADTVIQLERPFIRDIQRVMVRVTKTRGVDYRKEPCELNVGKHGIEIQTGSPLLRFGQAGEAKPVPIRLLFHSESEMQRTYNEHLRSALNSTLTDKVYVEPIERLFSGQASRLSAFSAIDELQVWQLDEFQAPGGARPSESQEASLYKFPAKELGEGNYNAEFIERLRQRMGTSPRVFPYFVNIGLLAYRIDRLGGNAADIVTSWTRLAETCKAWEKSNSETKVFFDFPKESHENFNCLFFEILLSINQPNINPDMCGLIDWLVGDTSIEAYKVFWLLGRRSYQQYLRQYKTDSGSLSSRAKAVLQRVNPDAVVWRHWYTTLNQMFMDLSASVDLKKMAVCSLPQQITVAGEWYLAIPSYSTAPAVGLEIIRFLTSRHAEVDRMQRGVGLPTRKEFYERTKSESQSAVISPYFSMQVDVLRDIVNKAFFRSKFGCYSTFSGVLAYHLKKILEITNEQKLKGDIKNVLSDLREQLGFVMSTDSCAACSHKLRCK